MTRRHGTTDPTGDRVRGAAIAVSVVLLATGGACSRFSDDVARNVDEAVDVYRASDGTVQLPGTRPIPPAEAGTLAEDAGQLAAEMVAPYTDDLDVPSARQVVSSACTAADLVETAEASTTAEAVEKVLVDNGGNATFRDRVEALTEDLEKARTSGEVRWLWAKFTVCEAA